MTLEEKYHTPLALAAFGLVFLVVGVYAAVVTHQEDTGLARTLRAAPVVDAVSVAAQPPGTTVLVEGRLAAGNPPVEGGLVTLQRQEAQAVTVPGKSELRISWKTLRTDARPLLVDTPAGALAIVNTDYGWRDVPRRVPEDSGVVTAGMQRLAGFAAGDRIVAHATVVDHEGRRALKAVEIDAGPLDGYLASKRGSELVGYLLGGAFALVGLGLLASAGVGLRRAGRAPAGA
jgi:hypothetical protein